MLEADPNDRIARRSPHVHGLAHGDHGRGQDGGAFCRRGLGVVLCRPGIDIGQAQPAQGAFPERRTHQDFGFRRHNAVGVGHSPATGIPGPGLVDIFLAQLDQQARSGGETGLEHHGEGNPDDQDHQKG